MAGLPWEEIGGVGLGMIPGIATMGKKRKEADKYSHANLMDVRKQAADTLGRLGIRNVSQRNKLLSHNIGSGGAGSQTAAINESRMTQGQQYDIDEVGRNLKAAEREYRYGKRARKMQDWETLGRGAATIASTAFLGPAAGLVTSQF